MRLLPSLALLALVVASSLSCSEDKPDAQGPNPTPDGGVPESGRVQIAGLKGPVDVIRDKFGMTHIRATSLEDALRVEGYQVARDRTVQLELIRRSATGRLAELLGDDFPDLIDEDIAMRTIGLARTAAKMVEALPPDQKMWVDAYADGISQFNARVQTGDERIPASMIGIPQSGFAPWTAVDVIAIARFQALNLSYDGDTEIAHTDFVEAARTKFDAGSVDPLLAKRAGFLADVVKFAPQAPAKMIDGFPNDPQNTMGLASGALVRAKTTHRPLAKADAIRSFRADRRPLAAAGSFTSALQNVRRIAGGRNGFTGSNNWVVGPGRSANGHAMVASDPHLGLDAPATFWLTHVTVASATEPYDFAGVAFPGLPGVILGFNADIGWGSTTANYDVSDVYEETLTGDQSGVVFMGSPVAFEKVRETIQIAGRAPLEYDVLIVPHHGPVVPTITAGHEVGPLGSRVLSIRWTGHAPTKDLDAVFGLLKAKNVEDARTALRAFAIGAQNWVVADTKGDIFFTSQSQIPKREPAAIAWDPQTFSGTIPAFVLPGDGSAEWTGQFLEEAFVPHAKNPAKGYVATANNDQVGNNLDNDPTNDLLPNGERFYTAAWHDIGFRAQRIQDRIEATPKLSVDDMSAIQGDIKSAMGTKLTAQVLTAIDKAAAEAATPGTHPDLTAIVADPRYATSNLAEVKDLLTRWGTEADFEAASGMDPDNAPLTDPKQVTASRATTIFNVWMTRMIQLTFDDEITAVGSRFPFDKRRALLFTMLATPADMKTFDAGSGDSAIFDDMATPAVESRDERIVRSLLDAVAFLKTRLGDDTTGWRWGKLHAIRFDSLVALWGNLSIPATSDTKFPIGFPRGGDGYNVDVASYGIPAVLDANTSFQYGSGPVQRFVIEMDPAGVKARNALPGGNIWDTSSNHFKDLAELWRRNQTFDVPFRAADVDAQAEGKVVYETLAP